DSLAAAGSRSARAWRGARWLSSSRRRVSAARSRCTCAICPSTTTAKRSVRRRGSCRSKKKNTKKRADQPSARRLLELDPQISDQRQVVRRHQRQACARQVHLHHVHGPVVVDVIEM